MDQSHSHECPPPPPPPHTHTRISHHSDEWQLDARATSVEIKSHSLQCARICVAELLGGQEAGPIPLPPGDYKVVADLVLSDCDLAGARPLTATSVAFHSPN